MRKIVSVVGVLSLIIFSSCKKGNPDPGGTWSLNNVTYSVASCSGGLNILSATNNQSGANQATVSFVFGLTGQTPTSGTYYAEYGTNVSPQGVYIQAYVGSSSYAVRSAGTQPVSVAVNNGLITISASGIWMSTSINSPDSVLANFNIQQTQ